MSITIPGVLTIKTIEGARGAFSVGDLRTDVGEFRIKDAILDEYEAGQYTGRFVISNIFPFSYSWRGRVSIEIRARLDAILLDDAEIAPIETGAAIAPIEQDPLDEESTNRSSSEKMAKAVPLEPVVTVEPESSGEVEASSQPTDSTPSLFGKEIQQMIDNGEVVKLDPTVDRSIFRQQRDALKVIGYTFNPATQSWSKSS